MKLRGIAYCACVLGGLSITSHALAAGELVINEYNAVGEGKYLEHDPVNPWEGSDSYFGRIEGNGNNWIELVVNTDHLDIRGWTLNWSNTDPDSGVVTFSNDARWSNLRAGTILTIIETLDDNVPEVDTYYDNDYNDVADSATPGTPINVDTDFSYNPAGGDFWINAWLSDQALFSTGTFKVDNDNWQATIKDDLGNVIEGPLGEGLPTWGGGGINSHEIGRLELDPSAAAQPYNYDDADNSTFGAPNDWDDQAFLQDFSGIRGWFTIPGDLNADGYVGLDDLQLILDNWNQSVPTADPAADIAGPGGTAPDGYVGLDDLQQILDNWNTGTLPAANVPEPAGLTLLGLGTLAVLRRRA